MSNTVSQNCDTGNTFFFESFVSSSDTLETKPSLISEADFLQFVFQLNSDIQENLNGTSLFPSSQKDTTSDEIADWIPWSELCDSNVIILSNSPFSTTDSGLSSPSPIRGKISSKRSYKQKEVFNVKAFWTEENIKKLMEWADQLKQDWKRIAKKFRTKHVTPTIVRNKYREIKYNEAPLREKFTHQEDLLIAKYYSIYGFQWNKIAMFVKSRTSVMIKNRFYSHIKKYNLLDSLIEEANQKNLEGEEVIFQDY
mgnify:CR=1 FL=1